MYMWQHQTLLSWRSALLIGELMPNHPALSSNILLPGKRSYYNHTILDAPWNFCSFNHLSALGFGYNLYFSYSHFKSRLISLSVLVSLLIPGFSASVCVDHFDLCKRCMYMISVFELHGSCFLWGIPVNWGKKPGLISPVHQVTQQYRCQAKFKNSPKYETQREYSQQPAGKRGWILFGSF